MLARTSVKGVREEKENRTLRRMTMNNRKHKVANARGCALWVSTAQFSLVKFVG